MRPAGGRKASHLPAGCIGLDSGFVPKTPILSVSWKKIDVQGPPRARIAGFEDQGLAGAEFLEACAKNARQLRAGARRRVQGKTGFVWITDRGCDAPEE